MMNVQSQLSRQSFFRISLFWKLHVLRNVSIKTNMYQFQIMLETICRNECMERNYKTTIFQSVIRELQSIMNVRIEHSKSPHSSLS